MQWHYRSCTRRLDCSLSGNDKLHKSSQPIIFYAICFYTKKKSSGSPRIRRLVHEDHETKVLHKVWVLLTALSIVALSGCATLPIPGMGPYVDPNDVCAAQKRDLVNANESYLETIFKGAYDSAANSTMQTIQDAIQRGGDFRNFGSTILRQSMQGAFDGYYNAMQKDIANRQILAASIHKDIVVANSEIDKASVAFIKLRDCRFQTAERIKSNFNAGQSTREQAISQLDEVNRRFDDDMKIAEELGVKMSETGQQFQYASNELFKSDPVAKEKYEKEKQRKPARRKPSKRKPSKPAASTSKPDAEGVANVTETNVVKSKAFKDEVDQSKMLAQEAFSIEGDGTIGMIIPGARICEA